jgi:hypothetical protein
MGTTRDTSAIYGLGAMARSTNVTSAMLRMGHIALKTCGFRRSRTTDFTVSDGVAG